MLLLPVLPSLLLDVISSLPSVSVQSFAIFGCAGRCSVDFLVHRKVQQTDNSPLFSRLTSASLMSASVFISKKILQYYLRHDNGSILRLRLIHILI